MALVLGALNILGAVLPPSKRRLVALIDVVPIEFAQTAGATLVFAGAGLILVGGGLRRGYRTAFVATLLLLAFSAALHVFRSVQVAPAALDVALATALIWRHGDFAVRGRPAAVRRAVIRGAAAALVAAGISTGLALVFGGRRQVRESARAVVERLVGDNRLPFATDKFDDFITPALGALGVLVLVVAAWALFAPRRAPHQSGDTHRRDRERARAIVAAHGGGTLDYFALRDDKQWFFHQGSVVAYAVRGGVCLVSPDPIGPTAGRAAAWAAFAAYVHDNGWSLAVMGAAEDWLDTYRGSGLRPVYLGDEAIVDCAAFTLDGHAMKSLRGANNRVTKAGCTVSFHDPATLDPELAGTLAGMAGETRHGAVERGFSMTLSRLFNPLDTGLLLAVAHAADSTPLGFIQWTPATSIDGWSLDVMRRSADPDTPNGVTDFMIIATIRRMQEQGGGGLALNFAIMRAVLADETPSKPKAAAQYALHRLSERAQIESLWRFNEKYRPTWRPRYVVLDSIEYAATQGLVIAGAEGVDEIPVVGRFLASGRDR